MLPGIGKGTTELELALGDVSLYQELDITGSIIIHTHAFYFERKKL